MATGAEIANAYVALTVKMPGVKGDIERALGGSDARGAAERGGSLIGATVAGAVGGAVAAVTGKAISAVMGSIDGAIRRVDTLNSFPKIMKNLGYSSDEAQKSIAKMSDKLTGLPTALDTMAGVTQQLAPLTGGLAKATDLSLALNNALLAGGKSTDVQANAMEQYTQMLSVGKVDMAAWRSMVVAMPGQMDQLSKSLLGGTANSNDLYESLQNGTISFSQFNDEILKLNDTGLPGFASFSAQAKDATGGIGTSMQNLQTAIVRGLGNLVQKFAPEITAVFTVASAAVNNAFKAVGGLFDLLAKGDFTGTLSDVFGWQEDDPIVGFLLDLRQTVIDVSGQVVAGFQAMFAAFQSGKSVVQTDGLAGGMEKVGLVARGLADFFFGRVIPALVELGKWVVQNKDWLIALAIGVGAGVLAWKAWNAAVTIGKGVMLAFNLVMSANPIMLIVTAIAALVAGLIYFFTQTKLGKQIWAEFTRFLGEAWTNITAFFTAAYENVIRPVFEGIAAVATWLYENILKPVFDGIGFAVGIVAAMFKLQFDLIVNAFRLVGAIANWLWVNALQPTFLAIGAGAAWLWNNAISPALNAIGAAFGWLWSTIIQPIVDYISLSIQGLGIIFGWLYENAIRPAWEGIQAAIGAVWSWLDQNVFPPLRAAIDLVGQAFANTAKAIGTAWEGIKQAAAIPINFILDVVWNNGLRSFWNDMVDGLGLSDMKLPKANLIKFASGGVLPGYTPGRDVHQFWSPTGGGLALSGGEAIMRPEFTRAVGGAAGVARLNSMARSGMLAFKDGGVLGEFGNFASDVIDNLRKAGDFVSGMITDPIGTVQRTVIDGLLRPLLGGAGDNVFARTVGQLPINLMEQMAKLFQSKGVGQGTEGMGWQAMWALVQRFIPGATLNDALRPAGTQTATGSLSYHSLGRAIDIGPATMDTFNKALALFPTARELIFSPAGDRQLYNGQPYFWTGINRDMHWDHVHIAMANGGVLPDMGKAKLYDQGGWLPHGGVAVNRSGQPEAVLDPQESRMLRAGLGGGVTIQGNLVVQDPDEFVRVVETKRRRAYARAGVF